MDFSHPLPKVRRLPDTSLASLDRWVSILVGGRGAPTGSVMEASLEHLRATSGIDRVIECSSKITDLLERLLVEENANVIANTVSANTVSANTVSANTAFANLAASVRSFRQLFMGSEHYPRELDRLLTDLPGCDATWTFKTTGAGGEDAILLFGPERERRRAVEAAAGLGWREAQFRFSADAARAVEIPS